MSPEELDRIEKVTKGDRDAYTTIANWQLLALVAEVRRLQKRNDGLVEALGFDPDEIEPTTYCPGCGIEGGYGHKDGCDHARGEGK